MFGAPVIVLEVALVIGVAVAAGWFFFRRSRLRTRRQLFASRLSGSVSERTIEKLAQSGAVSWLESGPRSETITALLCDRPGDIAAISESIHLSDGTISAPATPRFQAFWNYPAPQENHAARACAAALRWRKRVTTVGQCRTDPIRIGIHTGAANIESSVGSERVQFLASGHAVDVADYLLRLNTVLGTEILISLTTRKKIGEKFVTRRVGDFKLPGRERPLTVHELMAPKEAEQDTQIFRDEFMNALQLFQTGDFYHSQLTFQRLAEENPNDGPTKFYLTKVEEVLATPPESVWDGVLELPSESLA